jgi:hypothetical protein
MNRSQIVLHIIGTPQTTGPDWVIQEDCAEWEIGQEWNSAWNNPLPTLYFSTAFNRLPCAIFIHRYNVFWYCSPAPHHFLSISPSSFLFLQNRPLITFTNILSWQRPILFWFSFFGGTGIWTQGFRLAKLSHTSSSEMYSVCNTFTYIPSFFLKIIQHGYKFSISFDKRLRFTFCSKTVMW